MSRLQYGDTANQVLRIRIDSNGHRVDNNTAVQLDLVPLDEQGIVLINMAIVRDVHVRIGIVVCWPIEQGQFVEVTGCHILRRVQIGFQVFCYVFHVITSLSRA